MNQFVLPNPNSFYDGANQALSFKDALYQYGARKQQDELKLQELKDRQLSAQEEARKQNLYMQFRAQQFGQTPPFVPQNQIPNNKMPKISNGFVNDGAYQPDPNAKEVIGVYGQKKLPPQEPVDLYQDANRELELAKFMYQNQINGADDVYKKALDFKNSIDNKIAQLKSAYLAPALRVQDNPSTPDDESVQAIDMSIQQLRALGVNIDAASAQALRDPNLRAQVIQSLVSMGSPEDGAKGEIKVQTSVNEFQPYQFENLGGSIGSFNPKTGQLDNQIKKTIDPNTKYSQDAQTYREKLGNSSQEKIAAANRALQKYSTDIRAAISKGQLSVAQGNLAIKRRQLELGLPSGSQVEDENGIVWDD